MFNALEATVLVKSRSGYRVLPVFERHGFLYAKNNSFYVQLLSNNLTSNGSLSWKEIEGIEPNNEKGYLVL